MPKNKNLVTKISEDSTLSGRPSLGANPTEGDETFKRLYTNARREYRKKGDNYNYGASSGGDFDAD